MKFWSLQRSIEFERKTFRFVSKIQKFQPKFAIFDPFTLSLIIFKLPVTFSSLYHRFLSFIKRPAPDFSLHHMSPCSHRPTFTSPRLLTDKSTPKPSSFACQLGIIRKRKKNSKNYSPASLQQCTHTEKKLHKKSPRFTQKFFRFFIFSVLLVDNFYWLFGVR